MIRAVPLSALLLLTLAASAAAQAMPPESGVLPSQKQVQVRIEAPSKTLPAGEVQAALTGAIAAWNAALPADLKLVLTPIGAPMPPGEVVFLVRFDNDPSHFGKGGIDEIGDTRGVIDRAKNNAVVAVFLVDKPGGFSTTGAAAAHDLQLVMMHELGHALGVGHANVNTPLPPIMAPMLEENGKLLARTRMTLPALRVITAADRSLLATAIDRRKFRDVAGSYTGGLKVDAKLSGEGSIAVGTVLPVREGDHVITYEAGRVVMVYKGSRRSVPAVDLFRSNIKLDFPDSADGRALRTMTIARGNSPEEIDVEAEFEPLRASYKLKGTLKRPPRP